jgi:hypothetical protein
MLPDSYKEGASWTRRRKATRKENGAAMWSVTRMNNRKGEERASLFCVIDLGCRLGGRDGLKSSGCEGGG